MADVAGNGATATARDARPLDRPDVSFEVLAAGSLERTAAPTLSFSARISDPSGIEVYTVALSVMFTIEPGKRSYDPEARERLAELFGEPERWASTTGAFRWAQVDVLVPSFNGEAVFEIQVPCTYDHEIAATKYFAGLRDGVVPLQLHFNGTLFYRGEGGQLQMMMLPWDLSVRHDLPIETWGEMIDRHYPEGTWIRLEKETLDRLRRLKTGGGMATYDRVVADLLDSGEAGDDA
jgi:hypothetical protein